MITLSNILGIADFWGWLQILGTIIGIFYIYRYKNQIAKKYIKNIEKEVYKTVGIPATILFDSIHSSDYVKTSKKYTKSNKEIKHKRNVSELSKKIVASRQKWRCKKCKELLDFTYEIDHIVPLYKGGGNELNNLRALCRNCHGRVTLLDKVA